MRKYLLHVTPKYLLLIAGIVWMIAGGNILRIGFVEFVSSWNQHFIYLIEIVCVFMVFMGLIFYRMVNKHHNRISQIEEDKVPFYQFFDRKSYIIMICMITGGVAIRNANILPRIIIGVLYCGIGLSLVSAGTLFLKRFIFREQSN